MKNSDYKRSTHEPSNKGRKADTIRGRLKRVDEPEIKEATGPEPLPVQCGGFEDEDGVTHHYYE